MTRLALTMALIITILSAAATAHAKSTFSNAKTTNAKKAKGAKAALVDSAMQGVKPLLNAGEAVVSAQWEFTAGSKARSLSIRSPLTLSPGMGGLRPRA